MFNREVAVRTTVAVVRTGSIAVGVSEAAADNFLGLPREANPNPDRRAGQIAGDVLSIPIAAAEAATGGTIAVGGSAITVLSSGALAPASVPAVGAGLAMAGHGIFAATRATENLSKAIQEGGSEPKVVKENTPSKNDPAPTKQEPAIKERQREGARRERETQADLEREHPQASVQREQLLRDESGIKVKDPLTETGRRVDHVVIEQQGVTRSVETTSPTADKAAQIAKEQRVRGAGGNYVRDRRTGKIVPIKEEVTTEVVRRQ